jgi:hypothetical protein
MAKRQAGWNKVSFNWWYFSFDNIDVHVKKERDEFCVQVFRNGEVARTHRYYGSFMQAARSAISFVQSFLGSVAANK